MPYQVDLVALLYVLRYDCLFCCLGEESWILAKLVPYVVLVRTPEYTITYCMKYEVLRYTVDAQACKVYTYEY